MVVVPYLLGETSYIIRACTEAELWTKTELQYVNRRAADGEETGPRCGPASSRDDWRQMRLKNLKARFVC